MHICQYNLILVMNSKLQLNSTPFLFSVVVFQFKMLCLLIDTQTWAPLVKIYVFVDC